MKLPHMPGAGNKVPIKAAFTQRTAVMRASAPQGADFSADIAQRVAVFATFHFDKAAWREVGKYSELGPGHVIFSMREA
jgi:hypothetical protein